MKTVILFLAGAVSLFAQGSNTVYQTLATNSTDSTVYGPVRNIGQASHQVSIVVSAKPAMTCHDSEATYNVQFLGSNNTVALTAQAIPQIVWAAGPGNDLTAGASNSTLVQSYVVYPYIWVEVNFNDDTAGCQYTLTYSGSTQAATPISPYQATGQIPNVTIPAVPTSIFSTVADSGSFALASEHAGMVARVYGITYTSDHAVTLTLSCTSGGSPTGLSLPITLAANQTISLTPVTLPYFTCVIGNGLKLTAAGMGMNPSHFMIMTTYLHQ